MRDVQGFVDVEREGIDRGRGVDFYCGLLYLATAKDSVERKVLLDALKDLVV